VFNSSLQATTRKRPLASHLLKVLIQNCVKIFQRHPSLQGVSPGVTQASLGGISANHLARNLVLPSTSPLDFGPGPIFP